MRFLLPGHAPKPSLMSADLSDRLLAVDGLVVKHGAITAVRDVSMSVAEGELVVLLGANGAGKTSLLEAIMGIVRPASGQITFAGEVVTRMSPEALVRRRLAIAPEGRRIFAGLTVEENLRLAGAGASGRSGRDGLSEMTELFPVLSTKMKTRAGHLSGGQQQQLTIARALMANPRLLLLDEPSLGLAPLIVDQVFDLISRLIERRITILLVEQNVERACQLASRGYVLNAGRVVFEGSGEELRAADLEAMYLGIRQGPANGEVPDGAHVES